MQLILHLVRLFFRGAALTLAASGLLLGLIGLCGAFSDRADVVNHLTPLWLLLGLAGGLMAAVVSRRGERWAIVGLALAAVLANGGLLAPELLAARRAAEKGPATLKVVQFNAWINNENPDQALAWLLEQDADVVFLEEGSGRVWSLIAPLRKAYPFAVSCAGKESCETWIFSKKRMIARGGLYEENQRFSGAWATLADADGPFTVVATHFVWPVPAGPQQAQTRHLAEVLKRFDKRAMIVAGDFNSTPWSWSLRRQDRQFGLERRTRALATWPARGGLRVGDLPFPILPIDHVYAGREWKTVSVKRGPPIGSDHHPVVITLKRG